ncbi:pre T-cell antigen receptor alpha-like [Carassius gibelio]|uniref:pre T-cell antigen receptor alpha-like n=1 Tax=Carassius gibelio TaxID=101364 RepID=UPI00227770E4|nr:pre T-cell antigen receptor alpha-like [Carassius gibelio]
MLPTLLTTTMLFTMGSDAVPFAILSPPFHTDLNGLTILVCVVHDIHRAELEVAWISSGTRGTNPPVSNLLQGHIQSAMSVISVPSSEWMSYTCFVSHRGSDQLLHRHYAGFPMETTGMADDEETFDTCLDHQSSFFEDVRANGDLLFVEALRILLIKITIFDILMTVQAVIK